MPLTAFDHANIRTAHLDQMIAFYTDVLGLTNGPRPDFGFPGAWLYLDDHPVVHLVGVDNPPQAGGDVTLEHVAFRATGYQAFVDTLMDRDIPHQIGQVPGMPIAQVNVHDPDGNHLHIDFDTSGTQ